MVGGPGETTPGTDGHVGERAERRSSGHACPTSDNHIECSPNSEALPGNAGAGSRLALEGSVAPDAQELEQTGSVRVDPRWAIVTGQMTAEMVPCETERSWIGEGGGGLLCLSHWR